MSAGIILFAAFAVCLIVGVPVSISLGVASLCSVVFGGLSASSTVIAQRSSADCSLLPLWPSLSSYSPEI